MICIAKDYLCLDVFLEVRYLHTLYGAHCADRHEYGSLYLTMVG